MSKVDNVVPGDKWKFDESVSECFEDMLTRSIPQYEVMRNAVVSLAYKPLINAKKHTATFLDIGCSDGLMLERLISYGSEHLKQSDEWNYHYIGIDVSEPMLDKARQRFLNDNKVKILNRNVCTDYPNDVFDVVTSILSIQFTPIEYRQSIVKNVYDSLSYKDGVFIMVEKVLGNSATLNNLFVDTYYDMKRENGYSQEQIDRKRLSLEGVLVPVTNDWNIDLLKQAGFRQVDVFWRWMNFVGYVAIK